MFSIKVFPFKYINEHLIAINKSISRKLSVINEMTEPREEYSLKLSHIPVMAKHITSLLKPRDGQKFIDMTFGGGGHTKYLLSTNKRITIYCLDRDPLAYQKAVILSKSKYLANNGQKVIPLLGRFSELPILLSNCNIMLSSIDGVVLDLGASSMQFDDPLRGFAISGDGPLDMRMDGKRFVNMPTAADVVNTLCADHLAKIFKVYGEERHSKKIAQAIVDSRFMMKRIASTTELANLVANITTNHTDAIGRPTHSATLVFQALRIFVNNELNELNYGLKTIIEFLKPPSDQSIEEFNGGKLAVLSFHSLEDKIVKSHLSGSQSVSSLEGIVANKDYSILRDVSDDDINHVMSKRWKPINKHVILPPEEEILANPRSRSAKLRAAVRVL